MLSGKEAHMWNHNYFGERVDATPSATEAQAQSSSSSLSSAATLKTLLGIGSLYTGILVATFVPRMAKRFNSKLHKKQVVDYIDSGLMQQDYLQINTKLFAPKGSKQKATGHVPPTDVMKAFLINYGSQLRRTKSSQERRIRRLYKHYSEL